MQMVYKSNLNNRYTMYRLVLIRNKLTYKIILISDSDSPTLFLCYDKSICIRIAKII